MAEIFTILSSNRLMQPLEDSVQLQSEIIRKEKELEIIEKKHEESMVHVDQELIMEIQAGEASGNGESIADAIEEPVNHFFDEDMTCLLANEVVVSGNQEIPVIGGVVRWEDLLLA
ncbi:hypothetical protein TWF481_002568 [Arthrobotrys musiformis]|uniref:Uncharacterized protein n=1 Tax=Arthrobotrys musiformis TaxID=47236 RepID=A0AAV9VQQ2_9PEZI